MIFTRKQRELYQNKVNSSLVPIYFELRDNLRLEQVPERCIKEQVAYTSANSLTQWREYRQNTVLSFYLTISSFHCRKSWSFCINFLLFGSVSALNHLFLYACQLMFCNLYDYDSEKRPLYIKQLTPLNPSRNY